jgi:3-methyladenine DNA glycosylase AlkC
MLQEFTDEEKRSTQKIMNELTNQRISEGIAQLRELKDEVLSAIPKKKRQSQGITWVVQRISCSIVGSCIGEKQNKDIALTLFKHMEKDDILMGVPIFMMGEYGKQHPLEVFEFFQQVATSENWIVREFAQAGFRMLIQTNREIVHNWLEGAARSENPYLRRFVGETLRPVTVNRWMNKELEYSLSILRLLFHESHPYPRTSVGNNLSDLSRRNPDMVFTLVRELVAMKDKNSYWIAYRACRNLVKNHPQKVLDLLGVDEYHYKDRNYYRS